MSQKTVEVRSAGPAPSQGSRTVRIRPVQAWALAGAGFIAFQLYVYAAWILSGPEATKPGGTAPPGFMRVAAKVIEVSLPLAFVVLFIGCVIRPLRRNGRIGPDGLFLLAGLTVWWQDAMVNYVNIVITTNTAFSNVGSWGAHVPGWRSPHGTLFVEGPAFGVIYPVWYLAAAVLAKPVQRRAQARWPKMGTGQIIALYIGLFTVVDLAAQLVGPRLGIWVFPGLPSPVTLFKGEYYQIPLTATMCGIFWWAGPAFIRNMKNDKGETLAERGIDDLRASPRQKTGLRFLALAGILNASMLLLYVVPVNLLGIRASQWPQSIVERPYLSYGICDPHPSASKDCDDKAP